MTVTNPDAVDLVLAASAILTTLRARLPVGHSPESGSQVALLLRYAEQCHALATQMTRTTDAAELARLAARYRLYADLFDAAQKPPDAHTRGNTR